MRRLILTLALAIFSTVLGLHGTARADGPPPKPAPSHFANGRPVYDMEVLKHTPGVTFQQTQVDFQHKNPKFPAGVRQSDASTSDASTSDELTSDRLAYEASVTGSGYGYSAIYNSYYQYLGSVYQYDYIVTVYWYGVPMCVQGTQTTYIYGNVPVRATLQLYLSYFGGFMSVSTAQGWGTSFISLATGCYGTITGDTWFNLGSFACGASYYCNGSAIAQWTDYY